MSDRLAKRWPRHAALRLEIGQGVECRFLDIRSGYIPDSRCIVATTPTMGFPVGTVWYAIRENSLSLEVLTSYVEPWARRLGVRSALHRALIDGYPTVKHFTTGLGLSKASRRWMKVKGYKKDRKGWRVRVRKP